MEMRTHNQNNTKCQCCREYKIQSRVWDVKRLLRPYGDINAQREVVGIYINQGPQQTLLKTCGWMLLLHTLNVYLQAYF